MSRRARKERSPGDAARLERLDKASIPIDYVFVDRVVERRLAHNRRFFTLSDGERRRLRRLR